VAVLNAADYGAPTHRRRLFLVARNDGFPIAWPEPTHGDPKKIGRDLFSGDLKPWRTAAECIDWSLPCPSIFLTREEGRKLGVKRPLAENTLKRIALGVKRYVLDNPTPFIVTNTTGNPPASAADPLKTATTGNHHYLCTPTLFKFRGDPGSCSQSPESPLPTVTAGSFRKRPAGAGHALAVSVPVLARLGQTGGNGGYCGAVGDPLTTVTTKAEHLLVSPVIVPVTHAGERRANDVGEPLPTVTGAHRGEFALVAPVLTQFAHGEGSDGRARGLRANEPTDPLGTIHAGGGNHGVVAAFLAKHYGGVVGHAPDRPIGTVTAVDHHSLVAANLVHLNHGEKTSSAVDEPARTVTACGNHAALVYAFLTKYYSSGGQWQAAGEPLHTVTGNDRMGLVVVTVGGQQYAVVDIGMRMLRPAELARAQGFPDDVVLTGTLSDQVERVGNSVCPDVAEAVVRANFAGAGVAA
jgi:DNA (cytosine-5)-methyltransferase 1